MKVFVVDDSPRIRLVVHRQLQALNFTDVEEADDAGSLLDLLEMSRPELVFLDIQMPGSEQTDLLQAIFRANIEAHVIIMTSLDRRDPRVEEALAMGGWAHLEKPFYPADIEDLVGKIRSEIATPLQLQLELGQTHLFTSNATTAQALGYLHEAVNSEKDVLIISSTLPSKFREQHNFVEAPNPQFIWLTETEDPGFYCIDPGDLATFENVLSSALRQGAGLAMYMDMLDVLHMVNGINTLTRFIRRINDLVGLQQSLHLVSVNDSYFSPSDLAALAGCFDQVHPSS